MRTDMKIGVAVGIVVVAGALIYVTQRKSSAPADTNVTVTLPEIAVPPTAAAPQVQPPIPALPPTPAVVTPSKIEPCAPPAPVVKPVVPLTILKETPPAPAPTAPPVNEVRQPRYYVVKQGDTLSHISEDFYGTGRFWKGIYEVNKDIMKNPESLHVGAKLRIPYSDELAQMKID